MRHRRIVTAAASLVGLASLTGCTLYEDGAYRYDDEISGCLIPAWGCDGPVVEVNPLYRIGPPPTVPAVTTPAPLLAETIPNMGYGPCAEAPIYAQGVRFEWIAHHEPDALMGTCVVTGTPEQLDILSESAFYDE